MEEQRITARKKDETQVKGEVLIRIQGTEDGYLHIVFNRSINGFSLSPNSAIDFANKLLKKARTINKGRGVK